MLVDVDGNVFGFWIVIVGFGVGVIEFLFVVILIESIKIILWVFCFVLYFCYLC